MAPHTTLAFLNLGPFEILLIAIVGLLLFGRRLPEVGKNLGKTIVEFKKGLSSAEQEIQKGVEEADQGEAKRPLPAKPPTHSVKQIAGTSEEP